MNRNKVKRKKKVKTERNSELPFSLKTELAQKEKSVENGLYYGQEKLKGGSEAKYFGLAKLYGIY